MSAPGPIYGEQSEAVWHLAGFAIVEGECRLPGWLFVPGCAPLVILPRGWSGPARELVFGAALQDLERRRAGVQAALARAVENAAAIGCTV